MLSFPSENTIEIWTPKGWTQWCFCYKVQYLCGFSRSHIIFIIRTQNRKSAKFKLKSLKTNDYEPDSLFALAHKSASFKAYSCSFCSGVLYCNLRCESSNSYAKTPIISFFNEIRLAASEIASLWNTLTRMKYLLRKC